VRVKFPLKTSQINPCMTGLWPLKLYEMAKLEFVNKPERPFYIRSAQSALFLFAQMIAG